VTLQPPKWSSATYHVGDIKEDILVKSRALYGLVNDWREYLGEGIVESDDIDNVRRSTRTGRPAGDSEFVNKLEKLTGCLLQKQKLGPKKKQKE